MDYITKNFDYKNILYYFEQLTRIPHGSGNVGEISDYLKNFAISHDAKYVQDDHKNVIVFLPATVGFEDKPTIMLQGHMDMVCEKNAGGKHDFLCEPLDIYLDGKLLKAHGTTLGGDDGIAIAYMMAIIADKKASHPALELVMTTDEETGMFGAKALDFSLFHAKYLINLDSEEEGECYLGCAGGLRQNIEIDAERKSVTGNLVTISVTGLQGGHSGVEIDKNRTNANKLLSRILFEMSEDIDFNLVSFNGGKLDNAIPNNAAAEIVIGDFDEDKFKEVSEKLSLRYKKELELSEPGLKIDFKVDKNKKAYNAHTKHSFDRLICFLIEAPNGIQKMSAATPGLVESSLNMGIVFTTEEKTVIRFSLRSSVKSYKEFMSKRLTLLANGIEAVSTTEGDYPAWEYNPDSVLRETYKNLFVEEYGYEPKLLVMHAGLECGLIFDNCKGLDIISIGPDMKDVHSPRESLDLESAVRVFEFLEKLIVSL